MKHSLSLNEGKSFKIRKIIDLDKLRQLREKQMDSRAIAKYFNVDVTTIRKRLNNIGLIPMTVLERGKARRISVDIKEIIKYIEQGESILKISKIVGTPDSIIRHRLKELGIKSKFFRKHRTKETINKSKGYLLVYRPEHPRAAKSGLVSHHMIVWEESNNKVLPNGWLIHHLNGIKDDNRPENLKALPNKKHFLVLSEKAKRIRELEKTISELKSKLQLNFIKEDNIENEIRA